MKPNVHRGRGPTQLVNNASPGSTMPYGIEWNDWFGEGAAVVSAQWDVGALVKGPEGILMDYTMDGVHYKNVTIVTLSGFQAGVNHAVTCRATSADGDVDERTMLIYGQGQ